MTEPQEFIARLKEDIEGKRLTLPVLPDVALKVHSLLDDPKASTNDIARVISLDAAISARLIHIANSPMFRGRNPIEDIQSTLIRLGNTMVRNLITVMLVENAHQARAPAIRSRVSTLWKHNVQVAALSYVLARNYTSLRPDEAMLAGLLHDIGVLPILEHALNYPDLLRDSATLDAIIAQYHCEIGANILESWKFPKSFVDVAARHEDLDHRSELLPELIDVVIVANLHTNLMSRGQKPARTWKEIPAFETLSLTPEESLQALKDAAGEIREIIRLFRG